MLRLALVAIFKDIQKVIVWLSVVVIIVIIVIVIIVIVVIVVVVVIVVIVVVVVVVVVVDYIPVRSVDIAQRTVLCFLPPRLADTPLVIVTRGRRVLREPGDELARSLHRPIFVEELVHISGTACRELACWLTTAIQVLLRR